PWRSSARARARRQAVCRLRNRALPPPGGSRCARSRRRSAAAFRARGEAPTRPRRHSSRSQGSQPLLLQSLSFGGAHACGRRLDAGSVLLGALAVEPVTRPPGDDTLLCDRRAVDLLGGLPGDVAEVEVVLDRVDLALQRLAETATPRAAGGDAD